MKFTRRETNGTVVLTISGEIEVYNTTAIQAEVKQLIADKKLRLVLDMDAVPFIDSTGIGVILLWHKGLKDAGGGLKLVRISAAVDQVFQLTRLNKVLEIYASEEEALAAFG